MTRPAAGFSNKEVAAYFDQSNNVASGSGSNTKLHGGKLAGVVIGSIAGAIIIAGGCIYYVFILRKRRQTAKDRERNMHEVEDRANGIHEAPPDSITARFSRSIFRNLGKRAELEPQQPVVHEMDVPTQVYELPVRYSGNLERSDDKKD